MRLYGYEGYPVVEDGRVIGLLTRRAVDRAIAHRLNLTAAQLMDAGEITVYPRDRIEILQNKMTDSGWGQIPVVHPDSGKIIGIVTRTDLLKTLTPNHRLPTHQNLAARLEVALPKVRLYLLKTIARAAHEQRIAIYIVGGFVRDLLLDRPGLDFDLVVEGDAISLAKSLARAYGGRVTSHTRFGTAKWLLADIPEELTNELALEWQNAQPRQPQATDKLNANGDDLPASIDLITARTEFYTHPTALPTVEQGSIKLDLHRRDFTINTLALRMDGRHYGELHDYWGGLNDLKNGLVRVLHSLSFVDDPTRMLRAVRFEQRFNFEIEIPHPGAADLRRSTFWIGSPATVFATSSTIFSKKPSSPRSWPAWTSWSYWKPYIPIWYGMGGWRNRSKKPSRPSRMKPGGLNNLIPAR